MLKTKKHTQKQYKYLDKPYQQYTRPKNKKHKHTQQQYNVTYNKFKNLDNM